MPRKYVYVCMQVLEMRLAAVCLFFLLFGRARRRRRGGGGGHVHANMNFPDSLAFSRVTRCRAGIRSPREQGLRNDASRRLQIRKRSGKVFTVGGSKWLCRWAANKSAVRKSGYALLLRTASPAAYLTSPRRWICPVKISAETRPISSRNLFRPLLSVYPFLRAEKSLRLSRRCKVAQTSFIYVCAREGTQVVARLT